MSTIKAGKIQPPGDSDSLQIFTNTAERMTVTSDGLVGIGTSTPQQKLHVIGEAAVDYLGAEGASGGALRLATNSSYSFIANNQYFEQGIGIKRSRAGGSSIIQLWNTNDALGSRIDFLVGGTGAKDSVVSNKNAMSIDADGSIVLGNNGYGVASAPGPSMEAGNSVVSKTIHKHHIHILGPTVKGDCWYIGEIGMDSGSGAPMNVTITHACHVGGATEACVFNFATDYSNDGASESTFSSWKCLPSISRSQWESQAYQTSNGSNFDSLDSAFTIDMRKKKNGGVQLRLRACHAGFSNTAANSTTNLCTFVIETTGYFQQRFVRGTSGTNTAPLAPTTLASGNEYGTAQSGYLGKKSYEFPVSNGTVSPGQHKPSFSGLFINGWGRTTVRSEQSEVLRVESLAAGTAATTLMTFIRQNSQAGYMNITNNAMTLSYTSDHRLKNNVRPLVSALDKISKLNPVSFNWIKGDEPDTGFIAHEVQSVIPNAAFGEKDAVKEDGSILPQSVSSEKLIAWLVAGTKELKAIVDTQSAEITALKSKMGM